MFRYCILLLSIIASAATASAAPDWHDDIISTMNSTDDIDRSVVVNRQQNTRNITNANYRYTFKSRALYNSIREKLISRETDASTVIIKPGKDGEIVMRFKRPQETRNYRLSVLKKGRYQLVVSVNEGEDNIIVARLNQSDSKILHVSDEQKTKIMENAEKARQNAAKARENAEKARQNAAKARENAAKARENAARARNSVTITRTGTSQFISIGDSNSAEAKSVSAQLKAAEQERKRLLNK